MTTPKFLIKTLGCKANLADSQLLEGALKKRGWAPLAIGAPEGDAQLVIVNSCTVTDEADRQSRKMAQSHLTTAQVVYTGCGAEVSPDQVTQAHWVVGNQDKHRLVDLVLEKIDAKELADNETIAGVATPLGSVAAYDELKSRHPMDREWPLPEQTLFLPDAQWTENYSEGRSESARTRSFVKIQEGCNAFCTYCIIPYGRGPSRSLSIERCVSHVQNLVLDGAKEIILTGTNIGDYGTDWGAFALCDLLIGLLEQTEIERIRLGSLDPTEINQQLLGLMSENSRICPHFHVSLQSPVTRVLKLMKRKYDCGDVKRTLNAIAQLRLNYPSPPNGNVYVGMDVITGFPGETDADFEETVTLLRELPWTRLHVFPYSERTGTPATRLPGKVEGAVRTSRAKHLRELSQMRLTEFHQQLLTRLKAEALPLTNILVEGKVKGPDGKREWRSGYTPNYLRVIFKPTHDLPLNQFVSLFPSDLVLDRQGSEAAFISL